MFSGVVHVASFVNSGQLSITLNPSDLAAAGSFPVVVTNPSPGGGSSNIVQFTISPVTVPVPPVPTGLSPGSTAPPGVTVTMLTPTLGWNSSPGATAYAVAMINNATGAAILAQKISTTSIVCPMLVSGVTYAWTVEAYGSSGPSAEATPKYFTVATVQTRLTGTWQGTWGSVPSPLSYRPFSATITQAGDALTGSVSLADSPCFAYLPVSGSISGNQITLVGGFDGEPALDIAATVDSTGTSINGLYKVVSGVCYGDYGVITAQKSN
jgi:hypothetical protein